MRLWRLARAPFIALDGSGPERKGARYSSPGRPVVNFTSEAGSAVLVAVRYLPDDPGEWPRDYLLGWTDTDAKPELIPDDRDDASVRDWVDRWLDNRRSLFASIPSRVLPEGDIVMMNPLHDAAAGVKPLITRKFDFTDCLHHPPMLDTYRSRP